MRIIVFNEKHGNRYFKADTKKELQESCWKILEERFLDKFYGYEPEELELEPVLSPEEIVKLPVEYQKAERRKVSENIRRQKQHESDVAWFNDVRSEVENPAGQAYDLLDYRADYQYEGYSFETLE